MIAGFLLVVFALLAAEQAHRYAAPDIPSTVAQAAR
jgi:hypothetical protein